MTSSLKTFKHISDSDKPRELAIEELESRMMLSTVQIFAAGDTGQEELQLITNGQLVDTFQNVGGSAANGQFQEFIYQTEETLTADDIRIQFANDLHDPANQIDRNLTVDRIVIDGETFHSNSENVFSVGVYQGSDTASGFGLGSTLHGNGFFEFGQNPATASNLTVFALGLNGDERFQVEVDGLVLGSFSTEGESGLNPYEVSLNQPISASDVRVRFINDLYKPEIRLDRNLIVDRISINGNQIQTESPSVFSTGTYLSGQGIASGNLQTEILHANGFFQFSDSGVDLTPPQVNLVSTQDITGLGFRTSQISIEITDDVAAIFPPGNLDTAISIVDPNGQTFQTLEQNGFNGPNGSRFVNYLFISPFGRDFLSSDNGTYLVVLNENTVPDDAGNFAVGGVIGSFEINIPA